MVQITNIPQQSQVNMPAHNFDPRSFLKYSAAWMHSSRVITSTWRSNHLLSAACVFVSQAISSTLQKYSYCMLLHDCGKTFLNSKWRFRKNHPPGFSLQVSVRSNTQLQPRCLLCTFARQIKPTSQSFPLHVCSFKRQTKKYVLYT